MGVGGNFWDILKPYARTEGFNFLRNKRVAVDLSYWIVQHETAIKSNTLSPHIRVTFFRTINLFSKFGALPVFVVDGTPSPLKSRARIARFFRASGIDLSSLPVAEEGISVERNGKFLKCVQECIELLKLLGMPVLKARGEAEALCAQLNKEGHVDACITADSDAFLFGAECVIKCVKPNSKEPFECYYMSDIEDGLGLKRKHLIAISLLVGNDHDLNGVQGIGLDTALRLVKSFSEDEILNRLHEIGRGDTIQFPGAMYSLVDSEENSQSGPHCSLCGHPGSKRAHLKFACEFCSSNTIDGCVKKPVGFKCNCSPCDTERKLKEHKKNENWQMKVCERISMEQNFPNDEIIGMYLSKNNEGNIIDVGHHLSWEGPNTEMLVAFLTYLMRWQPSYIRQRMLPMLSTILLREKASNPTNNLLHGQYKFESIQRVKVKFGHQLYVVKWKKTAPAMDNVIHRISSDESDTCEPGECNESGEPNEPEGPNETGEPDECINILDEPVVSQVQSGDGGVFLLTDEDMELVQAAFPDKVDQFLQEKELTQMKSRRKKTIVRCEETPEKSEATSRSVQLSIKEFYRSSKALNQEKLAENLGEKSENISGSSKGKRNVSQQNLPKSDRIPKSVRRRLLFE